MENKKAYLGTGWSFPPEFNRGGKRVLMTEAEEDIQQSLHVLLTTKLGERVMLPGFGCNLEELLFESLDATLITYVADLIKTAIVLYEPRIEVLHVDIADSEFDEGKLVIHIHYLVRATNTRSNIVFPFYKEEGTDIQ